MNDLNWPLFRHFFGLVITGSSLRSSKYQNVWKGLPIEKIGAIEDDMLSNAIQHNYASIRKLVSPQHTSKHAG